MKRVFSSTLVDVKRLTEEGKLKHAIQLLEQMDQSTKLYFETCASILQGCMNTKALTEGKHVHMHLLKNRSKPKVFLWNTLIQMYVRCGSMEDAFKVFERMALPNVFTWTMMISGYAQHGRFLDALNLFLDMELGNLELDKVILVTVLGACTHLLYLEHGKRIHAEVLNAGYELDIFVGSSLLDMYAKCWCIDTAWCIFDKMPTRDIVLWNAMIAGYAQVAGKDVLLLLDQMQLDVLQPNEVTFINMLSACTCGFPIEKGKWVHASALNLGYSSNILVSSTLIDMYAKWGRLKNACDIFFTMPEWDVVSWNTMVGGYVQHGYGKEAFQLFLEMQETIVKPNEITFVAVLNACAEFSSMEHGKKIHVDVVKARYGSYAFVGSALVDMYAKCGGIKDAAQVFDRILEWDVVSWNAMIGGYAHSGNGKVSLNLYKEMCQEDITPNEVTFASAIVACASITSIEKGKWIHASILKNGCNADAFVGCTIIDMYAKCGDLKDARLEFVRMPVHDVFLWNAIITGHAQHGKCSEALELFDQMQAEKYEPDEATFVSALTACSILLALERGKQIHRNIMLAGCELDVYVGSSLIDMYSKCQSIESARQIFDRMPIQDVVSWSSMIAGYAREGDLDEALLLYKRMRLEDLTPDSVTFVSILGACAEKASLEEGKWMHNKILGTKYETDISVGISLVDMYSKCGCIEDAHQTFDRLPSKNVILWSAMIGGYAQHGDAQSAIKLMKEMHQKDVDADKFTFTSLLSACSHACLLDEGCYYFILMSSHYGIRPIAYHYACMVDLLGRAGYLDEAAELADTVPLEPSVVMWMSVLGVSRCEA